MQFLIVSMNDRIKNIEASLNTGESAEKIKDNFNRQSLQAETESVSSTDHITSQPLSDSSHSADTDSVTLQGEDVFLNRAESLLPWQASNENFDSDRVIDQHTSETMRRNGVLSEQRCINRGIVSRSGSIFQQFTTRSGQKENVAVTDGNPVLNIEGLDNLYRSSKGRAVNNVRNEQVVKERGNTANERQGSRRGAQSQNMDLQRSNWNNAYQPKRNGNRNDLTSPSKNSERSLSRKQAVMETWSLPGIENTGRECKKRKI